MRRKYIYINLIAAMLFLTGCEDKPSSAAETQSAVEQAEPENPLPENSADAPELVQTELGPAIALADASELAGKTCDASTVGGLFYIQAEQQFYYCQAESFTFVVLALQGEKGDSGVQGISGVAGVAGADGEQGEQGAKGQAGERGEAGESAAPFTTSSKVILGVFQNTVIFNNKHYLKNSEQNYISLSFFNAHKMFITSLPGCANPVWVDYKANTTFPLSSGVETSLFFKFQDINGVESICYQSDATITLDDTPPLVGSFAFTDGLVLSQNTTSTPFMAWSSEMSDALSGIGTYEIKLGTFAGGSDILEWTDIKQNSSPYLHTGLDLAIATNYHLSIRAVDRVGNFSAAVKRDPFIVPYTLSGSFDLDFNEVGLSVDTGMGGSENSELIHDIEIDQNNKAIVVGSGHNGTNGDAIVMRFNKDGSLDTSLNGVGIVALQDAASVSAADEAYAVAVDRSNRIVVAGSSSNGSGNLDATLWRLLPNGALDATFNGTGSQIHDGAAGYSNQDDEIEAIVIADDNSIFAAGYSGSDEAAVIWKFTPSGQLDTAFNSTGYVISDNIIASNVKERFMDLTLLPDGGVVAVGYAQDAAGGDERKDILLLKVDKDGNKDTNFDGDPDANAELLLSSLGGFSGFDQAYGVILDSNNKIVLSGGTMDGSGSQLLLLRLNLDGTFDTEFSTDGKVVHPQSGFTQSGGLSLLEDQSGRILVTGIVDNSKDFDLAVWRFTSEGELDASFAGGGFFFQHNLAGGEGLDMGHTSALDQMGRLYIGAQSFGSSNSDYVTLRLK